MTQEEYERIAAIEGECARTHGVSAEVARRVVEAIRPSIRLISSPESSEGLGTCRLGGLPDLPVGVQWPTFANPDYGGREYPYRFLMQIDLAAVSPFDLRGLLPKSGHLLFFCHWQDDVRGHEFGLMGDVSKVVFAEPRAALRRSDPPDESMDFRIFRAKGLAPAVQWMVPAPCEAGFEPWGEIEATPWTFFEEVESRIERVGEFADERMPKHRLLGYADFIQCPGLGDNTELLAQVDTDPTRPGPEPRRPDDMLWGDCGTVYYLIDHDDLARRQFDRAFSSIEMC
jgi:uncharacterized protein YwqG